MNLKKIKIFAEKILSADHTAHDWLHACRVEKNALKIMPTSMTQKEVEIIRVSCWLHDTIDAKILKSASQNEIDKLLKNNDASKDERDEIFNIINNISYSKNLDEKRPLSKLGKIVQDADRLDAIGAIGIARAFYYGGSQGHTLYHSKPPRSINDLTEDNYREENSVINHFYEKLLQLEGQMNTPLAKKEAQHRTKIMQKFLDEFKKEIAF